MEVVYSACICMHVCIVYVYVYVCMYVCMYVRNCNVQCAIKLLLISPVRLFENGVLRNIIGPKRDGNRGLEKTT